MPSEAHTSSWYAASAHGGPPTSALQGDTRCDVCVVGAGITGISTALHLAERGYRVVVLEQNLIGWGASGRNGGQLLNGFSCEMGTLRKLVGREAAGDLWKLSLEAVDLTRERVEKHAIDCALRWGYLHAAIKPRQLRELRDWVSELQQHYDYEHLQLLEGDKLDAVIGSERYVGGALDHGSGHLHPLNYTLGLATAAVQAGVTIHEGAAVDRVEPGHKPVVHTAAGQVRCDYLVFCGNAYLGDLQPPLSRRVMPVGTYIIATEPLGAERAQVLLPGNAAVADTNFVLDYFRCSEDQRMLFGGRVSYSSRPPSNLESAMRPRMLKVFPALADVRIEYAWGGFVAITMNRAPHFGRLRDNVYFAQGFSGHGLALTGLAGKLIAEAIAGTAERLDLFARIPHRPFPGGRWLRTPALVLAMAYYRLRDLVA